MVRALTAYPLHRKMVSTLTPYRVLNCETIRVGTFHATSEGAYPPSVPAVQSSRSSRFKTFPVEVRGSSSMNTTSRGTL